MLRVVRQPTLLPGSFAGIGPARRTSWVRSCRRTRLARWSLARTGKPFSLFPSELQLAAQPQTLDQRLVARFVRLLDVVEETAARRNHLQQAAAGMVVLAVQLEVFSEVGDTLGEDRYLDFRRAGIVLFGGVVLDERGLPLCGN